MQTLPIEKIFPDKSQPREYFAADKMLQVRESIKAEGMTTPIDVMDNEDGTYLIIDGERRYRVATELGWRDVPVVVNPKMSEVERFVRQFHIQEYHEPWTPIEKARSIIKIGETMGLTLVETCAYLKVSPRDTRRYVAFAELADPMGYIESELPLDYTEGIKMLKGVARKVSEFELDENFSKQDEKMLESRVIDMVKGGTVKNRSHLTKIADAMKKEPATLTKLLNPEQVVESPEQLFREAKAKGAHALRNTIYNARYIVQHGKKFLESPDVKISPEEFDALVRARDVLTRLIDIG